MTPIEIKRQAPGFFGNKLMNLCVYFLLTQLCHVYSMTVECIQLNVSIDFGLSKCGKGRIMLAKGWKWHETKSLALLSRHFPGPWASRRSAHLQKVSGNACSVGWSVGWGVPRRPANARAAFQPPWWIRKATATLFLRQGLAPPHCNYTLSLPGSLRAPLKSFRSLPHACLHILAVLDAAAYEVCVCAGAELCLLS